MQITAFSLVDGVGPTAWSLQRCEFRPYVNLIVGASGVGKTKLLNGLFNVGMFAAQDSMLGPGTISTSFVIDETQYEWNLVIVRAKSGQSSIAKEVLRSTAGEVLIERDEIKTWFNGEPMPRLPSDRSALRILREEDAIRPIVNGFASIRRRSFAGDELDRARAIQPIAPNIIEACRAGAKISSLYATTLSLSGVVRILSEFYKDDYRLLMEQFKRVFPTVEDIRIVEAQNIGLGTIGSAPLLLMKEHGVANATPIMEWSAGMLKVLLLVADVVTQPRPSIYMIDEYENSLGVNAIDFFPGLINELGEGVQFFITSHHPMLINAIPINDWVVLGRSGCNVRALYGGLLKERYGVSHHEQYVKLLNDPFYKGVVS